MAKFAKFTGVVFLLGMITAASPTYGQSLNVLSVEPAGINMWTLRQSSQEDIKTHDTRFHFQQSDDALVSVWPDRNSQLITPINTKKYTKFDPVNFDYPIAGRIKLSVRESYQQVLTTNNLSHSNIITTHAPVSGAFKSDAYEVATTATTGFTFKFD